MTHATKVKMARKMLTKAERKRARANGHKQRIHLFTSFAWSMRHAARARV